MRLLASILVLIAVSIASVSLWAQDQPAKPLEHWVCGESKCQAAADPLPGGAPILVTLTANSIEGGNVLRLKGSVEIRNGALVLQADEADYQWVTGDFKARGNVRIKPVAPPSEASRVGRADFRAIGGGVVGAGINGKNVQQVVQTPNATLIAKSVTHEGDVFQLKGAATIRTDAISVTADEATYQQPNGEIDAQSEVRVKPMPLISPGLAQFGIK